MFAGEKHFGARHYLPTDPAQLLMTAYSRT